MNQLIIQPQNTLQATKSLNVPPLIAKAGKKAVLRFVDFFTAEIENVNTRNAYTVAVIQFGRWCDDLGIELAHLNPSLVAAYIRQLGNEVSRPTVKQHLAAIRSLFDYLVIGQIMPFNPANSVRGPNLPNSVPPKDTPTFIKAFTSWVKRLAWSTLLWLTRREMKSRGTSLVMPQPV